MWKLSKNKYKDLEIKFRKKLNWDFLGSFQSAFKWMWIEFDSLREYYYWDNIKNIDWKTTAKTGDVFIKNFEEERDVKVLFVIQNSKSLDFWSEYIDKRELLENIFFILSKSALMSWYSIWIEINNKFIKFSKSEANIIKTLDLLKKIFSTDDTINLKDTNWNQKKLINNNYKNTLIFFLWDNINPNLADLKYLNLRNEIIYLNIFDNFEENLSDDSFEINIKSNNFLFNFINIFTWNKEKKSEFVKNREEKLFNLKKKLKKYNIEYLKINTHNNIFLELFKFFTKI